MDFFRQARLSKELRSPVFNPCRARDAQVSDVPSIPRPQHYGVRCG